MRIKRIHVNQHNIRWNNGRTDEFRPVITVRCEEVNHVGFRVIIDGPSEVIYSPDKPLPCGARLWIETTAKVVVDNVVIE